MSRRLPALGLALLALIGASGVAHAAHLLLAGDHSNDECPVCLWFALGQKAVIAGAVLLGVAPGLWYARVPGSGRSGAVTLLPEPICRRGPPHLS